MEDNNRFGFCPKCGALARDGVCQSCGYQILEAKTEVTGQPVEQPAQQPLQQQQPMQPPKKSGKTAVVVCVIVGIVLVALVALILAGVYLIQNKDEDRDFDRFEKDRERKEQVLEDAEEELAIPEESAESEAGEGTKETAEAGGPSYAHTESDVTEQNWQEEGQDPGIPYYSGPYNDLKNDLSYQIGFTNATYYSVNENNIYLQVEYPQIVSGDVKNIDYINAALYYEYEYYRNFFEEEFKPHMTSDQDAFYCIANAYVTYMDEKILSVVFNEQIEMYLQGEYFSAINFYCLNFDLETGTVLENTDILNLDEDFAIDFRQREVNENGDEALTLYSDQEILEMLKDGGYLVVFYTPMGLEVGLNLDDRVVYVTYEDYEQYLNIF